MAENFAYRGGKAAVAFAMEDYYIWDCSVVFAKGQYHLFCSRWKKDFGFGWNWVFNSEVIEAVSDTPAGPYTFKRVVLPRRGREYFDGMNTHNTCIKYWNGQYYLYYMGTTYGGDIPTDADSIPLAYSLETWNRKRIGLAVADDIDAEFVRRDTPLLEPRDCRYWDSTITTNPSAIILPDGKTYLIYKSRAGFGKPLQLGIAVADRPDGKFTRLCDRPILQFADPDWHIEDPFIWYDANRSKFCLIAKDDSKNGSSGLTGEWGAGFYAESDDCIHFEVAPQPKVYSRQLEWQDGHTSVQGNLERPSLLFDESGRPTHLFCATGDGEQPYDFKGNTYVVCMELEQK